MTVSTTNSRYLTRNRNADTGTAIIGSGPLHFFAQLFMPVFTVNGRCLIRTYKNKRKTTNRHDRIRKFKSGSILVPAFHTKKETSNDMLRTIFIPVILGLIA